MSAAKRGNGVFQNLFGPLMRPFEGPAWVVVSTCLCLIALGVTAYALWQRYGSNVLAHDSYRLSVDKIEITQPPPWVRAEVRTEAALLGSLDQIDLRETDLTVRVAQAFAMHPWVRKVKRVSKHYPARLQVDLDYRRPAAMVEVTNGLLPVDAEGVVLPTEGFPPEEARHYPRIVAGDTSPVGPPGTPWGNRRVTGAAQIASAIGEQWQPLELYRIVAVGASDEAAAEISYELWTRNGGRVVWGQAPGSEAIGEAKAPEKVARLVQYVRQHGSLDQPGQNLQEIDLRNKKRLVVPDTALRSGIPAPKITRVP